MTTRHEPRSAVRNRTLNKVVAATALPSGKRWDQSRLDLADDDKLYEPDWEISDQDLESYVELARDD